MNMTMRHITPLLVALAASACADTENPQEINDNELITTVVLYFAPQTGGDILEFGWADPENDGSPEIDDIILSDSEDYDVTVSFLNELEDPAEDITDEVEAETDEHQVFFTGNAIEGPANADNPDAVITHTYADTDDNGFPVGLNNVVVTERAGTGTFTVTLRHLPPENNIGVKTGSLADDVAASGFTALPGATDAQVSFDLTVQ
jgi:hypothetical protein